MQENTNNKIDLFENDDSLIELAGIVERITYQNSDSNFTVFKLKVEKVTQLTTVVGNVPAPLIGENLLVYGTWVEHNRFGKQFKAVHYDKIVPTTKNSIEQYLASGVIKGIGPSLASRLVKHFGTKVLDIIESEPERLSSIPGFGRKKIELIKSSYAETANLKDINLFLNEQGISSSFANKIYAAYGNDAVDVIKSNPYRLIADIKGIGFFLADKIALSLGIEKEHPARIKAGIDFSLLQTSLRGHCFLPEDLLVRDTAKLLSLSAEEVREEIKLNIANNKLYTEDYQGVNLIYFKPLYIAEKEVANNLLCLKENAKELENIDSSELIDEWEKKEGIFLAKEQKNALLAALNNGVLVLTGGPGTGKTTIVKGIIDLFEEQGLKIMLAAPTGRAAKRLSMATTREALTVHRLLEASGQIEAQNEPFFARDEYNLLDADVIIIDEISMMDIVLMSYFLKAVPLGCRVVLVGDADQLPAVGPGSVLKDIIRSNVINVVQLTEIFRQTEESLIVLNAHKINRGMLPDFKDFLDFQFREMPDDESIAREITKLCKTELVSEGFDVLSEVQILAPMHGYTCGVENLNKMLQNALNPSTIKDPFKKSKKVSGYILRTGDKVMQVRNNYLKKVFNGDIGFIISTDEERTIVRYSEDEIVYEKDEQDELTLAYAMSVHKSQGSEYGVIIMPLSLSHHIMLQRNLLYTAVTRAKERVILIGDKQALKIAVSNDRTRKRYSLLAERLGSQIL
ncbi:ATP-dependent RecD-like DNA helicase [Selenomonadales bacterium OttesenSCG-928-I06]|nr:ATP-dependent RecD-like DNA helicase [Selenomonadales bacterium OttesenSCG-928-I06]